MTNDYTTEVNTVKGAIEAQYVKKNNGANTLTDSSAYANLGVSANSTQKQINTAFNSIVGDILSFFNGTGSSSGSGGNGNTSGSGSSSSEAGNTGTGGESGGTSGNTGAKAESQILEYNSVYYLMDMSYNVIAGATVTCGNQTFTTSSAGVIINTTDQQPISVSSGTLIFAGDNNYMPCSYTIGGS